MPEVANTGDLVSADLDAIRRLLDAAFAGRFDESDWDHAVGGRHVIVREAGQVVAGEIASRHRLGVLSTGEWHFDERLGWRRRRGPTYVRSASGVLVHTPDDDGGIMVPADDAVDLRTAIVCSERAGDDW